MGVIRYLKGLFAPPPAYAPPRPDGGADKRLGGVLLDNLIGVRAMFTDSGDLIIHEVRVCGVPCAVLMCEGMVDTQTFSEMFAEPLTRLKLENPGPEAVLDWVRHQSLLAPDQKEIHTFGELFRFMMSGFVVLLIDGVAGGSVFGIQGFSGRSVGEPAGETNVRGSREGFSEMLRPNMSLLRRRFKSPDLVFEMTVFGDKSRTDCTLVYLRGAVSDELLREVKYRLSKVKIDVVLESGYLQPFLDSKPLSLFSGVGVTERPDTLCAKVAEGLRPVGVEHPHPRVRRL